MSVSKSYLQMINSVLAELRENPVATANQTVYSTLIGKWINDAKRQVEDAWDWQPLQLVVDITLTPTTPPNAGTRDYDLTALNPALNARARIQENPFDRTRPMAFDITTGNPYNLIQEPVNWINQMRDKLPTPQFQTMPINFGLIRYNNGVTDGILLRMWESPTQARNWRFYFTNPQDDLVNDGDTVLVPWMPIVAIATDIALNERGEELGEPGTTIDQRVRTHIVNAIGVDAQFQEYKSDFIPD